MTYHTSAISTRRGYYSTLVVKGEGTIQERVFIKV